MLLNDQFHSEIVNISKIDVKMHVSIRHNPVALSQAFTANLTSRYPGEEHRVHCLEEEGAIFDSLHFPNSNL